jgi:hypothetical protein
MQFIKKYEKVETNIYICNYKLKDNLNYKLEDNLNHNLQNNIIGDINCVINHNDLNIIITSFYVYIPNNGYGTILLQELIKDIKELYRNIKTIELDDMTDRFRKNNNIYIKNGFNYINVNNDADGNECVGPEMILYL